jgi:hypothetical protein
VALASGKIVKSVQLPAIVSGGKLHVFAVAFSAASYPTGPIIAGVSSSLCVDDSSGLAIDGNKIQIWSCNGTGAQSWTANSDGTLSVIGKCMDVAAGGTTNNTLVDLNVCDGAASQIWTSGTNGSLVNQASAKCLDDPGSSTSSGTQLQLYTCDGSNAQKWSIP